MNDRREDFKKITPRKSKPSCKKTLVRRKVQPSKGVEDEFWQVATQLRSTKDFAEEVEKKTQNILALLFNRIQLSNDRMIVSNGNAMQIIMRATQAEAIRSQQLAVEMRKDGLSVKTIAVLTMFFLPGTSFAAILAMPFFSTNKYLMEIWILGLGSSHCSICGPGIVVLPVSEEPGRKESESFQM
ncbi:hypothetical protein ACEPPN_015275 [Leptodophora sp. 'Broadleaf-Isolate-01']